jgi:hypothetical protein
MERTSLIAPSWMEYNMQSFLKILLILLLINFTNQALARKCIRQTECCQGMGGIHYCDSSAGRFVCRNGDYSSCYCTRHAIMDFQDLRGCCLWQGGIAQDPDIYGMVVCRDGSISEICSMHIDPPASTF